MIATMDLRFSYKNINFSFPDVRVGTGKTLLVTGSSGKGKTTLLHLLGGLLKVQTGMIIINGTDITTLGNRALDRFRGSHIGIVFQQAHYIASVSVLDNLLLAGNTIKRKESKERAIQLLTRLGIREKAHQKPANLSLGQQQRLSIARALINKPALLLADEPTSSLDEENGVHVAEILQQQALEDNASLIVVSHDQRLQSFFQQKILLQ